MDEWDNWDKLDVTDIFQKFSGTDAARLIPDSVNALPLYAGMHSFTFTDARKEVLTKVTLSGESENETRFYCRELQRESEILSILADHDLGDIEIPRIIQPAVLFEDQSEFAGYIQMSVINGVPVDENSSETILENIGASLSRFHNSVKDISIPPMPDTMFSFGTQINRLEDLGVDINKRLDAANIFLQNNLQSGNIHGDFGIHNALANPDTDEVIGFVDFGRMQPSANIFVDLLDQSEEAASYILEGYRKESGIENLEAIIAATELSRYTADPTDIPPDKNTAISEIEYYLNIIERAYTPSRDQDLSADQLTL